MLLPLFYRMRTLRLQETQLHVQVAQLAGKWLSWECPAPNSFFFKKNNFIYSIYLFSTLPGLHCCQGFSLVVVLRLLFAVASFVLEHRLQGAQASVGGAGGLSNLRSQAPEHKLNRCCAQAQLLYLTFTLLTTFIYDIQQHQLQRFPCGSAGKESACNAGDQGLIPGWGRSPGERKGYPLQYCGLQNSMDCIVHGVAKSWIRLIDFSLFFSCYTAFGFFPNQGSNPCVLNWQADSLPLNHQGSPKFLLFISSLPVTQLLQHPCKPPKLLPRRRAPRTLREGNK